MKADNKEAANFRQSYKKLLNAENRPPAQLHEWGSDQMSNPLISIQFDNVDAMSDGS